MYVQSMGPEPLRSEAALPAGAHRLAGCRLTLPQAGRKQYGKQGRTC